MKVELRTMRIYNTAAFHQATQWINDHAEHSLQRQGRHTLDPDSSTFTIIVGPNGWWLRDQEADMQWYTADGADEPTEISRQEWIRTVEIYFEDRNG